MDSVIGIDLSGLSRSTKGRTVAAHLALGQPPGLLELQTIRPGKRGDRDLVDWIVERRPVVVGIDAPLTLPHSVLCDVDRCPRCEPGVAEYLGRDVDRLAGGMPTVMLAAIAFRGIWLARHLRREGLAVVEVYPGAAYAAWGLRSVPYEQRADYLTRIVGPFEWTSRDDVDAVCGAIVAGMHVLGTGATVSGIDGSLEIPK